MKLRKLFSLTPWALAVVFIGTSCVKEGPPGQQGPTGTDANETCKQCHNPSVVDEKVVEFEFSKHHYGEVAFEESGNPSCAPCHTQKGFQFVAANSTPATFVKDATSGKYSNQYVANVSNDLGELSCFTCHSSLHTSYTYADFSPFTTTAPVSMNMWGGAKTINLTQDNSKSNLCIKCHQPRPITKAADGNVIDYNDLKANPTAVFYSPTGTQILKPSYRTGTHYGTVGAIVAGMGGVEFAGPMAYASAVHASKASCSDCHQAALNNKAGGHTFSAAGNFNGCNVADCHNGQASTSSAKYWINPRTTIKGLLDQLAGKMVENGVDILSRNPSSDDNLWYGLTTNNYDGYLNLYDPLSNPNGPANNPNGIFQNPSPSSSWTADQKAYNLTLPKLTLTNAQMGALINFDLCLREFSLGIHNLDYSKALLTNTIAILP